MKRGGALPRRAPLKAKAPMRKASEKRRAHRQSVAGQSDRDHMAKIASLPCVICWEWEMQQESPTQVHHVIHGRHGTRKVPDTMTIPLCEGHHLGDFDTSKVAIHREPDEWKRRYGLDRDWLNWVEERIAA